MKLLYITASMPFGPGEAFLIPEAQHLSQLGWELRIVPRSPSRILIHREAEALLTHTVARGLLSAEILRVAAWEGAHQPWVFTRAAWKVSGGRNLLQILRNLSVLPKGMWLARVARTWGADHIHAHWATTTATMAWIASELTGIPWSMSIHRGDIVENNQLSQKVHRAQFVRVIAESSLRLADQIAGPIIRNKAILIPMGTELATGVGGQKATECHSSESHFTVVCPANLVPVKGHAFLLQAAARLASRVSNWTLEIAGAGPLRKELERLTCQLGLANRVRFLGQVAHEELLRRYAAGDVHAIILASLDLGNGLHEGIPVALMEAMAEGVPVIAFATGGIPELLGDGAGVLARPGDAEDLAAGWERLMTDRSFRQSIGEAGRKRVCERFSVAATTAQLSRCLRGDLKEPSVISPTCSCCDSAIDRRAEDLFFEGSR